MLKHLIKLTNQKCCLNNNRLNIYLFLMSNDELNIYINNIKFFNEIRWIYQLYARKR